MSLTDRFEIGAAIHTGSVAAAYPAVQIGLDRRVLLKVMNPNLSGDAELVERFRREGKAIARLDHPNVVRVFESGVEDGLPYLAIEWVDGGTLKDELAKGPLPDRKVKALARDILEGLKAVHSAGLLHRDLKPDNILLTPDGRARLADFSLAGFAQSPALTSHGALVGSPAYLSPELVEGARASPQSDLFGLGVILFEALTGSNPFAAADALTSLDRLRRVIPPKLTGRPHLDPALAGLIDRLLERDPSRRPKTAEEALSLLSGGTPAATSASASKSRGYIAITATAVAALALISIWLLGRGDRMPYSELNTIPAATPVELDTESVIESDTMGMASTVVPPTTSALSTPSTLSPARLHLIINPWAEVFIDGRKIGTSPLGVLEVVPGSHTLRLVHDVLPSFETQVELEAGETDTLMVDLEGESARLTVTATPWGYLWLNGDSLGLLPRIKPLWLTAGEYNLEITHPSLKSWEDIMHLSRGERLSIKIDLTDGTMIATNTPKESAEAEQER